MENKHHIDELFRNKLSQYEIPADERLKKAFLTNAVVKKNKRVMPLWYFSAAAAILVTLSFFWITNSSDKSTTSPEMATNSETLESPQANVATVIKEKESTVSTAKPRIEKVALADVGMKNRSKVNKVAKITQPKDMNIQATGLPFQDELIPDELTLALMSSEKKAQKENVKNVQNNSLFQKEAGETIYIVASDFDESEEQLMIQELNSDSPVTLAQATMMANERMEEEKSLIAKVFTGIKHLKHGEKVNLETFALAKNSEDTFIGNEIDELKEKWSRVKSRISK